MEKKAGSTKTSDCFIKTDYESLNAQEKVDFINRLMKFDVQIAAFNSAFKNNKRNNSNSTMSESKKK